MSGKKVLFVDDSQQTLTLLARIARLVGSIPRVARSLDEAVAVVRQDTPDLVLVDLRMPQTDGLSVIRVLRQALPAGQTRIFLLTAEADPALQEAALQAGARGVLEKPLSPDILLEVLDG
ncbi:MAG TPA: response regulator [Anaerolineae bacterium]|nr:response regulator [Anaerolineae bacterium]